MNDIKGIIEDVEKSSLVSDKVIKEVIEIIGQEKWQEINDEKSDICTTTGELIITLKGIPDLEKENAELKESNKYKACVKLAHQANVARDNLDKAAELHNEFMRISKASDEDFEHDYSELIGETEQFIKEIEK